MTNNRKRAIPALAAAVIAALTALMAACPVDNDDNTEPEPALKLTITQSGRYLNNTVVEMEASDDMATIYYTRDGSEPTEDSERYNYVNKPRMQFYNPNTGEMLAAKITIKAIAIDDAGLRSRAVTSEYQPLAVDESVLSDRMKAQVAAWKAMSGGTGPDNPIAARLPATITVEDVRLQAPSDESPNALVVDGLGSLFVAIAASEKYIALDLSDVVWKGPDSTVSGSNPPEVQLIPFCHDSMYGIRPGRDRLVSVKFPAGIAVVEPNSFRSTSGLKLADFTGCSQLKTIDQYAFADDVNLEEVKLDGCTSLTNIEQYAFTRAVRLQYLDFSQTSLAQVKNNAVQHAYSLKYIEFPETLEMLGDYCFQRPSSLEYIRFRSENFRPYFGWCNWLYFMDENKAYNGLDVTHRVQQPENTVRDATDKNFVIFHPDTPYWVSGNDNLFWFNSGASYHHGQHVPLPTKTQAGYSELNNKRGEDMLAAQEPYRGLSQLTLNFGTVTDEAGNPVTGGTVTARVISGVERPPSHAATGQFSPVKYVENLATGSLSSITIPDLTGQDLNELNTFNAQQLTGRYDRLGYKPVNGVETYIGDISITWNRANLKTSDGTDGYDRYLINGVDCYDTEPSINKTGVRFGVLELRVSGGSDGYLRHYGEDTWLDLNTPYADIRTIRYVWVSEDVSIYRRNRGGQAGIRNIFITLKQGWNYWDVSEMHSGIKLADFKTLRARIQYDANGNLATPLGGEGGQGFTSAEVSQIQPRISNTIGSGKIPSQNPALENDDNGKAPAVNPSNPLRFPAMTWILTTAPYKYPD